ncbi:LLM class flavin-dependent oxidoreductase [Kribbella sp. VKM Ac-2566]|uniref:LLM class flavin-dependent oxidoreductase n=1 Tax=Kribbella sp. VKM Ac-2566 TaxID=2512218 RepID=UPI0010D218F6|nr:LLM class flavin-dependent oxidoreductase [Kribbella sp. VKM Ac-2566]TDX08283.1 putative F420-dependent oxidoreductase [Kribbella sp. VKM Ac-2566]
MHKTPYWGYLFPSPASELTRTVREFDELGFQGTWATQVVWGPGFPLLSVAAAASERLQLGTGIAYAFARSPMETALSALDLDILSGGRTVLGLGLVDRPRNESWFGVRYGRPLAHLREVIEIVRMVTEHGHTGELGIFKGDYYDLDLRGFATINPPVRPRIPIVTAAAGDRAIKFAASFCDGVLGHPIWPARALPERVLPALDVQLPLADRTRSEFDVHYFSYTTVHEDPQVALAGHRGTVAFYASNPNFRSYWKARGWGDVANAAVELGVGNGQALLDLLPDAMVRDLGIVGTPPEVRAQVAEAARYADSITLIPPTHHLINGTIEYNHAEEGRFGGYIADAVYRV